MLPVSIVVIAHSPNETTKKALEVLKKQKYRGRKEMMVISENKGLAENMNIGIKKAKYNLVVTLHGDCIPEDDRWLEKLVKPFENKEVVATVSDVYLPPNLWSKFDIFARALTLNEKNTIRPLLDEKGCAYRKKILEEIGLFNYKDFRTAGEDFDMYIKLKKKGQIAYPGCKIIHIHPTSFKKRLRKNYQNANGFGALVRIHGKQMPKWYLGILRASPVLGMVPFIFSYPFRKGALLFPVYLLASPIFHLSYFYGFWKGFFEGKQTI